MPHIDNITIHAFRGLKELELKDFSRINLFVGDNNCGKTSVLEAIYAFCCPADAFILTRIAKLRESSMFFDPNTSNIDKVKWLFPTTYENKTNILMPISISGDMDNSQQEYTANTENIFGKPEVHLALEQAQKAIEQQGLLVKIKSTKRDKKSGLNSLQEGSIIEWQFPPIQSYETKEHKFITQFIEPHAHRIHGIYAQLYSQTHKLGMRNDLIGLLQKFDPYIKDLMILGEGFTSTLHIEHEKTGTAPIMTFGDGLRRVLFIAMQMIAAKDGVCILDEIDNSIHTSVLKETAAWIVKAANKLNVQIFASTHSLEAVDAFIGTTDEELAVYKLDQGGTLFRRYSHDMLYRIRHKRGLDVR
ncbi:ATP/GTP-binding protein [Desulfovibrio sp. JC010]|uniref:AAA family ATPase n=1 Tax=Desulfovibrio sp. JC010 TaxID=2593641 RepID=UPI0013D30C5B|nr:AAA family ATPase [Desulfovibrio sp. JC010]NDV27421.1 AAA family ATPase [Desulfovibrio sp. JC010]